MTGTSQQRAMHVVLHAHSEWSYDAAWPLKRIAQLFGSLGVRAVLMSEHDTGFDPSRFTEYRAACADASTARCTLIPGIEYSCPDNDVHLLTWGLDTFLAEHRPVSETLQRVREAGGVSVLAHPNRRDVWRRYDPTWTELLSGIEVWNRKSNGIRPCRKALDLVHATGLPATIGCDFHRLRNLYPLTNRIAVEPEQPLEPQLVSSIARGRLSPCAFAQPLFAAPPARLGPALIAAAR